MDVLQASIWLYPDGYFLKTALARVNFFTIDLRCRGCSMLQRLSENNSISKGLRREMAKVLSEFGTVAVEPTGIVRHLELNWRMPKYSVISVWTYLVWWL